MRNTYGWRRELKQTFACALRTISAPNILGCVSLNCSARRTNAIVHALSEGIALRSHLPPDAAIFVLHGPMPGTGPEFMHHRLAPVLNGAAQVAGWRQLVILPRLPSRPIAISLFYVVCKPAFDKLFRRGAVRFMYLAKVNENPSKPGIF